MLGRLSRALIFYGKLCLSPGVKSLVEKNGWISRNLDGGNGNAVLGGHRGAPKIGG